MSVSGSVGSGVRGAGQRLEVLCEELAELAGQRNAIDVRPVDIVAEIEREELCGSTGARSVAALVAWNLGTQRRTRPMVVVPNLPTPNTTIELASGTAARRG